MVYTFSASAEMHNRQLHQREIDLLNHSLEAKKLKKALFKIANIDIEIVNKPSQLSYVDDRGNRNKAGLVYLLKNIQGINAKDIEFITNEAKEHFTKASKINIM